ncbi:YqiA/YcfP family alpha/beta fold hydrolase [Acidovorax sp. PRC11]|uniref:YqiA/YcfP family alpha/beta fold hydrolase n=1 Tax=Acidovorax sp. PRC11 TaxID=2962592 RepID=UPI002881AABF|nr:YqiA/YcfP family alpha/beta fold hydrolase [Acidovorax sp. PRC11]MDT0137521.1 YqiA/YcfP family alpha/beta fold hydrolase [Acidovorax sp. PRC11]
MPHTTTHLLYLHGFRSSPRSAKARQMADWMAAHRPDVRFWCPQLPPSPRDAMALVAQGIADWPAQRMAVVGSSLGGFYASWVAQHKPGCASVLLNPAVDPARDLERYIGQQTAWHDPSEQFYFRPEYIAELRALEVRTLPAAGPELAIIAKGDELLDWREMAARHAAARVVLLEGGDHALSDFAEHIGTVVAFCGLDARPA